MEGSIFDIFATKSINYKQSPTVPVHEGENCGTSGIARQKLDVVSGKEISKMALGDVGNTLKRKRSEGIVTKLMVPDPDEENKICTLPTTPLKAHGLLPKPSDILPLRSPLSDIAGERERVQVFSQTKIPCSQEKNFDITYIIPGFGSLIGDEACDSLFLPDEISFQCEKDNLEDILPSIFKRSDEDTSRLINFWKMWELPLELGDEDEDSVIDEQDYKVEHLSFLDVELEEPFPVPVFLEDYCFVPAR